MCYFKHQKTDIWLNILLFSQPYLSLLYPIFNAPYKLTILKLQTLLFSFIFFLLFLFTKHVLFSISNISAPLNHKRWVGWYFALLSPKIRMNYYTIPLKLVSRVVFFLLCLDMFTTLSSVRWSFHCPKYV